MTVPPVIFIGAGCADAEWRKLGSAIYSVFPGFFQYFQLYSKKNAECQDSRHLLEQLLLEFSSFGDNDAMAQFQFELKLPTAELTFWSTKRNQLFSWTFPR